MSIKELLVEDSEEWLRHLNEIPPANKDIYFIPEYFMVWQHYEKAIPLTLKIQIKEHIFLYPLFKKEIIDYELGKTYYDIFSAYGYGGVISSTSNPPEDVLNQVNLEIDLWCREKNVIAEFIREHPLIANCNNTYRFAEYSKVRTNVYHDFQLNYKPSSSAIRNQRNAIRNGLGVEIDYDLVHLETFQSLYNLTADRKGMDPYYYFDKKHFDLIKNLLSGKCFLINVWLQNQIIAAALFFKYGNKATYHLGASNFNFANLRANDLLFKTMVDFCKEHEMRYLSLGGGTTNLPDDSLFKFKKKYGNVMLDTRIGKNIFDPKIYSELCCQWEELHPDLANKYKNYILKYRINK